MSNGFEWDPAKAAANYAGHGVHFETATRVFEDPFAIELLDDRYDYGEERYAILGSADGRLIVVIYTTRGETIRLISARRAEPHERRKYHEENAS